MIKNNKNSVTILITGFLSVILIIFCAVKKDDIINKYYEYTIDKKYSKAEINEYYLDYDFDYAKNYTDTTIKNRNNLINFVYFALNSGIKETERYIDSSYTTYLDDIKMMTANDGKEFKEIIANLNNYVHPYNSSNNIKLNYGSQYKIGITINKIYTDQEIKEINKVVDKVISENITNSMPTKEKIRVIHDYIINNTEYDKLKYYNKDDDTYKSNTAYGVLIEGYGTCNGYADAMAIFLNKMNIINHKISNDEHIWNLVYLDGTWYHLDLTWDDPISDLNIGRDTYFLITNSTLKKINDGTHNFNQNIYSDAIK